MREWEGKRNFPYTIIAKGYTASEASALKQLVDFTNLMQEVYFTGLHEVALNLLASSYGIKSLDLMLVVEWICMLTTSG